MRGKAGLNAIPLTEIDKFYVYPYYYMNELPFFNLLKQDLFHKKCTNLLYFGPPIFKNGVFDALNKYLLNLDVMKRKFNDELFILLYIDKLDHRGHGSGFGSDIWKKTLIYIDRKLSNLYRFLKSINIEFNFVIFSDHGICNINETVNLSKYMRMEGLSWKNMIYLIDATIANLWFNDDSSKRKFSKILNVLGKDKVLYFDKYEDKDVLREYGVNFTDDRYGDVILQTRPGIMFFPNHYSELKPFKGAHGFSPKESVQNAFVTLQMNSEKNMSIRPRHISDVWRIIWSLV